MAETQMDALRQSVLANAYNGLLEQMRFTIQRRANISTTIQSGTKSGLSVWIGLFGLAKFLHADNAAVKSVLEVMAIWIPYLGMLEAIVLQAIARGIYQDEIDNIARAVDYEDQNGVDWGAANTRYDQLFTASYMRGGTSEAAGAIAFVAWLAAYAVARFFL